MSDSTPSCIQCKQDNTYFDGSLFVCPDCGHEFTAEEAEGANAHAVVDSNGTPLHDGDSVTVIKDLKVKGSSLVVKRGTKVSNIRLIDDPTHIDGKVEGQGVYLMTCFLRKN